MASHKYLYKFLGCSSRQPHFESSRMWFVFKLPLITNVLQGEGEDDSDNNEESNNGDAADSENVALKKAFKKWQDHRPSFAEMHSEDVKRRPRWSLMWSGVSKSHENDFLLIFHFLLKKSWMILHVFIFSVNVYQCTDSDHPDIQAIQVEEVVIAQS